ncbi:MAG: RNA polymerase sigma factor [Planctomycetales bacterium]|jgi:RNA polymerase sigma-70 factor (ECF subfamily)
MDTVNTTRPSLLVRIRDLRDEMAWGEFAQLYTPLIYRFARQSGLQDADASLVTQDVLVTVARTIHRFEIQPQDRLVSWLVKSRDTFPAD